MAIRSVKDIVDAVDAGRTHDQRFFKNFGTIGDGQWQDWSYASGQPAYDARIGNTLAFTPYVSNKNDAIYFPPIPAGMDRHLLGVEFVGTPSGASQSLVDFALYDLIGVYPLIDGDNTDIQEFDNSQMLPRYASGDGVFPVIVNHVSPAISTTSAIVEYVNSEGVTKTTTWGVPTYGINKVCYSTNSGGASGPLYCALEGGDRGVSKINSIQFLTTPGGLWAIYMCKPLGNFGSRSTTGAAITAEKQFAQHNGFNLPKILDGATLGLFYRPSGGARSVALHGQMKFVWG